MIVVCIVKNENGIILGTLQQQYDKDIAQLYTFQLNKVLLCAASLPDIGNHSTSYPL